MTFQRLTRRPTAVGLRLATEELRRKGIQQNTPSGWRVFIQVGDAGLEPVAYAVSHIKLVVNEKL